MSTIILHSLVHYFHAMLDCVLCYVDSWRWRCLCLSLGCVCFHICVDLCVSDSFLWLVVVVCLYSILLNLCNTCACSTVPQWCNAFFCHNYATFTEIWVNFSERCTFMENRRRCTIAGITVLAYLVERCAQCIFVIGLVYNV